MKRFISIILVTLIVLSLVGCDAADSDVVVNVEGRDELSGAVFGKSAMVEIGNGLYYDSTMRIVYWWNGAMAGKRATTPSPYYAPNGLPYRYNPETNTFEEINIYR